MSSSFRKGYTLKRRSAGSYVKGKWVPGSTVTTSTIQASIQPLTGRQIERLPEARRAEQAVSIFTDVPLLIDNKAANLTADVVSAFGLDFEIIIVEPWQSGVINHYKSIGILVGSVP